MREFEIIFFLYKYFFFARYLKHIILPMTKYSFYAGNVTYSVAQNVFNLYERCKESLDTNGNSWSDPITDFSQFSINIQSLNIQQPPDEDVVKTCANLAMNQNDDDNEEDMLVPLPKIETSQDENLSTIWLPLRRKHIFNINSRTSAFILFRYYVMVTQCFRYQGINQSIFNRKLKVWISENVIPYLDDDQLYPAFGAVLRIIETIRDQNEAIYQGTKEKKNRKSHRVDVLSIVNSELDEKFGNFSFDLKNRDVTWWIFAVALAAGITLLIAILIYLVCRFCCNRKKREDEDAKKGPTLRQKISNALKRSTHKPENDEFYEYKKIPQDDHKRPKVLKFENERSKKLGILRKMRPKRNKETIELPILNASDSEEIVLHESSKSISPSSSSFTSARAQKQKISEETDEIADLAARNLSMPPKFFQRIRSKSPLKKRKDNP